MDKTQRTCLLILPKSKVFQRLWQKVLSLLPKKKKSVQTKSNDGQIRRNFFVRRTNSAFTIENWQSFLVSPIQCQTNCKTHGRVSRVFKNFLLKRLAGILRQWKQQGTLGKILAHFPLINFNTPLCFCLTLTECFCKMLFLGISSKIFEAIVLFQISSRPFHVTQ